MDKAECAFIWDIRGREYLDFTLNSGMYESDFLKGSHVTPLQLEKPTKSGDEGNMESDDKNKIHPAVFLK